MSELVANTNQNSPSAADLDAIIAAEEAARWATAPEAKAEEAAGNPLTEADEPDIKANDAEAKEDTQEPEKHEETEAEKRISRLAYERRQAERRARELEAEVKRLKGEAPALPEDEQVKQRVEEQARQMAAAREFNERANAIYQEGKKTFGDDFDAKLRALNEAGLPLSPAIVETAHELGDAHRIIHYLARNPDEMEAISNMQMQPHRMAVAMAKVAQKAAAPKKQATKAPAPITPINGRAKADPPDDQLTTEAWVAKEEARAGQRKPRWL